MTIEWWRYPPALVDQYKISYKDAWNCTLREYIMLTQYKKENPIKIAEEESSALNIVENFKLRDIYCG